MRANGSRYGNRFCKIRLSAQNCIDLDQGPNSSGAALITATDRLRHRYYAAPSGRYIRSPNEVDPHCFVSPGLQLFTGIREDQELRAYPSKSPGEHAQRLFWNSRACRLNTGFALKWESRLRQHAQKQRPEAQFCFDQNAGRSRQPTSQKSGNIGSNTVTGPTPVSIFAG